MNIYICHKVTKYILPLTKQCHQSATFDRNLILLLKITLTAYVLILCQQWT